MSSRSQRSRKAERTFKGQKCLQSIKLNRKASDGLIILYCLTSVGNPSNSCEKRVLFNINWKNRCGLSLAMMLRD